MVSWVVVTSRTVREPFADGAEYCVKTPSASSRLADFPNPLVASAVPRRERRETAGCGPSHLGVAAPLPKLQWERCPPFPSSSASGAGMLRPVLLHKAQRIHRKVFLGNEIGVSRKYVRPLIAQFKIGSLGNTYFRLF